MNQELKTTITMGLMGVEADGISVTVALKNGDANGTRRLQRLLTGVLETIGWAGGNAALAEAVEEYTRDRTSGLQRTGRALAAGSV